MLLLLTIGLVAVAAVSLVIGFVSQDTAPIYISIACSLLAGVVLWVFSRMSRRQPVPPTAATAPEASLVDDAIATSGRSSRRPAEPAPVGARADDTRFPIEDYDELLVSEIVPLLSELDLDELDQVRAREEQGKGRASILRRIDVLVAELEGGDEPEDLDTRAPATSATFPIADYDELRVAEIKPLLEELDDDELEEVAVHEADNQNRSTVLNAIDDLLGGAATIAAPAARRSTAKKAPAKKSTARKAPAKKSTAKKAPAKKTTKKSTAKKAPAKKTAAKKSTAKKAPAKKTAAKKATAKKR